MAVRKICSIEENDARGFFQCYFLELKKIDSLLAKGYQIDGIETYNPAHANSAQRATVRTANREWGLAETGGSDAHL